MTPGSGLEKLTKDELQHAAADHDIEGRSSMSKAELADAIAHESDADASSPLAAPGPLRPAQGATNPKVAGPPPVADQPGLGRAANEYEAPGPAPNLSVDRIGAEIDRRRERAAEHREELASAAAQDEG